MSEQASTAKAAYGFVFYRNNGTAYIEVKNCKEHQLPNVDNTEVEKTHHGSPNRKKEFGMTLGEDPPTDMSIDFDIDDATHRAIYRDCFLLTEGGYWKREFPNGTSITGQGYVRNWKWGAMTPTGLQSAVFTFRESPAWDWDLVVTA